MNQHPESHPGKELKDHLNNVNVLAQQKLGETHFTFNEYSREQIRDVLGLICLTHDFGKATTYFQDYLNQKCASSELTRHAQFSSVWTYILIMKKLNHLKLAVLASYIVCRHHGELVNFDGDFFTYDESDRNILNKQLSQFMLNYLNESLELSLLTQEFQDTIDYMSSSRFRRDMRKMLISNDDYYLVNFLFSLLIDADKGDAIFNHTGKSFDELLSIKNKRENIESDSVDRYKSQKFKEQPSILDHMRNSIYKEIDNSILKINSNDRIFSINVPTGTGKTLAALNAALKLREKMNHKPRIIYVLPYTSIIDQNYQVFEDVLGNPDSKILIKDHHLADKIYRSNDENYEYDISEYLTESWDSEVIVTTFVQLLHSILTDRNRSLKKFANIANSIMILDEVQTIPHKYWKLIRETMINMCRIFHCRVILMTATMPLIFSEDEGEITELVKNKKQYFEKLNRINLFINRNSENHLQNINMEEFQNTVLKMISVNDSKSFLFIFNTIQSSLDFYHYIEKNIQDRDIIYLSTNIIPKHRMDRISQIMKNKDKNQIIVSTQMVEAGVDIDIDVVYRDFGPLDSINQAAGRCNRNGLNSKGEVIIFKLQNEKNRDFCRFIYGDMLLEKTESVLNSISGNTIEEKIFFDLANQYYKKLKEALSEDASDIISRNMLVLKYEMAFHKQEENNGVFFQLIDDNVPSGDVFIEWNDEAHELYNKYEIMKKLPKLERKAFFNSFKKDFLGYVIQVPKKYLPDKDKMDFIQIISNAELDTSYLLNTGFIRNVPAVATW